MSIYKEISLAPGFQRASNSDISLAPGFNRVWAFRKIKNRFNGFFGALSESHF